MHEVTYKFLKNEIKLIEKKYNFFSVEGIGNSAKIRLINQLNFLLNSLNKLHFTANLNRDKNFYFKEIMDLLFLEIEYLSKDLLEKPYYAYWRTIATKINWMIIEVNKITIDKIKKINDNDILKDEKWILKWFRNAISHRERFSEEKNKEVFKNILLKVIGFSEKSADDYMKQKWVQKILNNDDKNKRMQFSKFTNIIIKPIGILPDNDEKGHLSLEYMGYTIDYIDGNEKNLSFHMTFDVLSIFNLLSLINDILIDFCKKNHPEIFSE